VPGVRPAADLVGRDFAPSAPNQLWVADIKYIPTGAGWLYLAAVVDCFSRRVVGWSMRDDLRAELVVDALEMAVARPTARLIHPLRPRQAVRLVALRRSLPRSRNRHLDRLYLRLRQRRCRELLRFPDQRPPTPPALLRPRRSSHAPTSQRSTRSPADASASNASAPGRAVRKPNAKAERFIGTLVNGWAYGAVYRASTERAAALDGWLWDYNDRRRHAALGHQAPDQPNQPAWVLQLVGVTVDAARYVTGQALYVDGGLLA
jgi:transposase InsO family protein